MSNISVVDTYDGRQISLRASFPWWLRLIIGLFLAGWLVGWWQGEVGAVTTLLSHPPLPVMIFFGIWATGWTLGGLFAVVMLAVFVLPQRPDTLLLTRDTLCYAKGAPDFSALRNPFTLFRRRPSLTMLKTDIDSITVDDDEVATAILVTARDDAFSIGNGLTGEERQWLLQTLQAWKDERY